MHTKKLFSTPIAQNSAPNAVDDVLASNLNTPVVGNVTTNDSDPDAGQTLTVTQLSNPTNGLAIINPATGAFTYTPLAGFVGVDSFRYRVCDNGTPSLCDTAWVKVNIAPLPITNVAPIAGDDIVTTPSTNPITVPVKANDFDPNGTPLTNNPTIVGTPTGGTAVVNPDGTITVTPNPGFTGTITVPYSICDNGSPALCDTANLVVTVTPPAPPVNVAPIAQNDATTTPMDTPVRGTAATNDSDPNAGQTLTFSTTTPPTRGTLTLNADGTYHYTPNTGFVGLDSATYRVCDNGSPVLCSTAKIYFDVTPTTVNQNDAPMAMDDAVTATAGTPITIPVKANDLDPDPNQTLSNPTIVGTPVGGTPVVNPDGTVTFTPTPGFTGTATFQYAVCDNGAPNLCDTATVTVTVEAARPLGTINLPPVAVDDAKTTLKNVVVSGSVATNDTDPNAGQTLMFSLITPPANGTLSLLSNGNYTYTPNANYIGADVFTYQVCDNGIPTKCDTAQAFITIFDNPCITMNLKVLLEGPFQTSTNKMTTILNQRGLLPGQTQQVGQFAVATPAGQPFRGAPWNYAGTEGDTITTYPATVTDWVLVSFRTSTATSSVALRAAAWLHDDGTIQFLSPCMNLAAGSYYVVIEHRNHMGVMSPAAVTLVNNTLNFDFTAANGFELTNPPSFGQKLKGSKWVMYTGDGQKATQTTNFDINFQDSQLWKIQSGIFDQYRAGDFNLDADVNFVDQFLWKNNNGRYSGVPH